MTSFVPCETQIVCLPPGTYTPYACGGTFSGEVSWEVHGITGGATSSCAGPADGVGNFTVGTVENPVSSYYLVFDTQTSVDNTETVNVYSYIGGDLLFSNTGTEKWPGVDMPPLFLSTYSVYVEFIGPNENIVLNEGNWQVTRATFNCLLLIRYFV